MRHDVERCEVGRGAARRRGTRDLARLQVLAVLEHAAEFLFRFTARPTAQMILEMHSWRSAFPELAMIERELGAAARRRPAEDLATTPFGPLDPRPVRRFAQERANG